MAARKLAAIARPIFNSPKICERRAFATVVDRPSLGRTDRAGLTVQQQSDVQQAEPEIADVPKKQRRSFDRAGLTVQQQRDVQEQTDVQRDVQEAEPEIADAPRKQRRSLLDPPPKVTKRPPSQKFAPTLGLGGRVPRLPDPEKSQKIYFPNFTVVLCRNGPAHAKDPYTATFIVPKQLTKPDIVAFLTQVYGLKITGIRTTIEVGTVQNASQLERIRNGGNGLRTLRKPTQKKAIVQMESPFWYPRRKDPGFFYNQFDTDISRTQRTRALLRAGNREKPGFDGHSHRFRGRSPYLKTVLRGTQKRRRAHERAIRAAIPDARVADVARFEQRLDAKRQENEQSAI